MARINRTVGGLPETIPFVSPEEIERDTSQVFKARLGANEGNLGPSPAAIEAITRAAVRDSWKYSDPLGYDLRASLSDHYGLPIEHFVLGCGIDNLLGLTVRIFSEPGDTIVTSLGAYPTFNYHVAGFGRQLEQVPYHAFREDLDALGDAVCQSGAPIVYVSNPDNPMGTWWHSQEITAFADALPPDTVLVLDEAYAETAPDDALPDFSALPANVIRMRTFSKAYGLAGLRCGYAIGAPELIGQFNKVRDHFGVTAISQIAARAALLDQSYLRATIANISTARSRLAKIGQANGLTAIKSATNFVTLDTGRDAHFALALLKALQTRGVFIRKPTAPGLDHCIRVSVGRDEEIDWFARILPEALQKLG